MSNVETPHLDSMKANTQRDSYPYLTGPRIFTCCLEQMVLSYGVLRLFVSSHRLSTEKTWTGLSQVRISQLGMTLSIRPAKTGAFVGNRASETRTIAWSGKT